MIAIVMLGVILFSVLLYYFFISALIDKVRTVILALCGHSHAVLGQESGILMQGESSTQNKRAEKRRKKTRTGPSLFLDFNLLPSKESKK